MDKNHIMPDVARTATEEDTGSSGNGTGEVLKLVLRREIRSYKVDPFHDRYPINGLATSKKHN